MSSVSYTHLDVYKRQHLKKENTVIIGDSLSSDIQGGKNAGIKTIWFHRPQDQTDDPKPCLLYTSR